MVHPKYDSFFILIYFFLYFAFCAQPNTIMEIITPIAYCRLNSKVVLENHSDVTKILYLLYFIYLYITMFAICLFHFPIVALSQLLVSLMIIYYVIQACKTLNQPSIPHKYIV